MISESGPDSDDRERRLERALAAFLQAAERGDVPDRRDLLAAHPDLAADLIEFLATRAKLDEVAAGLRPPAPPADATGGAAVPPHAIAAGRVVGDYEIQDVLGWGGMGVVYRARQRSLGRPVALKVLNGGAAASPDDLRRFRREAEAIAGLDHPNIVPVYEIGEHGGHRFFSMRLAERGSLADRIVDYADDHRAAARIVAAVARAIDHAHRRGVLHRDLKPSNVLIDERGDPMVADFGLALPAREDSLLTRTGAVPGTPAYMAPEQVDGRRDAITPATDVHGLGAILYTLLTGRAPFRGASPMAILIQARDHDPEPPRSIRRSVDRDLETICLKCLQKGPSHRYASAEAMADDLERWLSGRPIRARRVGPIGRAWRFARRHPAMAVLAVAVPSLAATAFLGLFLHARAREELTRADRQARRLARVVEADRTARDLARAWRAWDENRLESARAILDRHRPTPGAPDPRGFAWRYLDRLARLGRPPLLGHRGAVYDAAFSPDGTLLATASEDRTIKVWDPAAGTLRSTLTGHTNEVNSVAFSPDGRLIVTTGEDEAVKIWDAQTGREVASLSGHADEVVGALFAPDGRRLISGGRRGKVILWDAATWRPLRSFDSAHKSLEGLTISPDGAILGVAGTEGTTLHDLRADRPPTWLGRTAGEDRPRCVAFSHDGRLLATAGPVEELGLWNSHDGSRAATWHLNGGAEALAFATDDATLAVAGPRGLVHLFDCATGARDSIATGQDRIWCVAYSPDGRTLATASSDGMVRLWDLRRDVMRASLSIPTGSLAAIEFSPDGSDLTSADDRGRVWIHDARRGVLKATLRPDAGAPVVHAALSPDSRRLAIESAARTFTVWDLPSGRRLSEGTIPDQKVHLRSISPDGRWIAMAVDWGDPILLSTAPGGGGRRLIGSHGDSLLFSPRGDAVSVWSGGSRGPTLWDVDSGRSRSLVTQRHGDLIGSQAFSADGAMLATGGAEGMIIVWDAATLEPIAELPGLSTRVNALAFAPDGDTLAVGEADRLLSLWDIATRRRLTSLKGHSGPVNQVRFSPDGRTLATCAPTADGRTELFLWSAARTE